MNDRFRFRAWNEKEKIMYYDAEGTYDFMFGKPTAIPCDNFEELLWNEDFIVEQCTGIRDKNGKLIYEGDLLETYNGKIGKIEYDTEGAAFVLTPIDEFNAFSPQDWTDCIIIGNVHENADMLKNADNFNTSGENVKEDNK